MTKKLLLTILGALIVAVGLTPTLILADEQEVKAAITVAAVVPSRVCVQYSNFTTNVSELLSDASQKATLTVKIEDCSQNPLDSVPIVITSNRGAIDSIDYVNSGGTVITSGNGLGVTGHTDTNGYVFFETYSNVPGEAIYNAKADDLFDVGQVKITFLPLPFPKNISVVIEVPKIISSSGIITLFKPKNFDLDKDKLVNLTMELRIPSWTFYLFIFVIILNITMFSTIMALMFRIKKLQKVEIEHIEQEEEILKKEEQEIEKIAEQS